MELANCPRTASRECSENQSKPEKSEIKTSDEALRNWTQTLRYERNQPVDYPDKRRCHSLKSPKRNAYHRRSLANNTAPKSEEERTIPPGDLPENPMKRHEIECAVDPP